MKQYVYRVTSSGVPQFQRGSVILIEENEGCRWTCEHFNKATHNFEIAFRAKRLGTINWRTVSGKRRQIDALIGKKSNA